MQPAATPASVRSRRARGGLSHPDRQARGRRHLRLGRDDAGRRRSRTPAGKPASATPIATRIVTLIHGTLGECVRGSDALGYSGVSGTHAASGTQSRALGSGGHRDLRGRCGAVGPEGASCSSCRSRACSARCREAVPIYGSGGFTTYTMTQLREQLGGWVERDGCRWVKMKVGCEPERDPHRVQAARAAIGDARPLRRCQRRLYAQAGAALGASFRREQVSHGSRSRSPRTISQA